jgi:hypothetical protein
MSPITVQRMGKYRYIYQSDSKWDRILKSTRNSKIKIGKMDSETGQPLFLPSFAEDMRESPELMARVQKRFPGADLSLIDETHKIKPIRRYPGDSVNYGITYFLYNMADSIGLTPILKESFPDNWKKIFTLSSFLAFENRPMTEFDDFMDENVTFSLTESENIASGELSLNIDREKYDDFFNKWSDHVKEKECFAFDAGNISSYFKNNVPWERGKEKSTPEFRGLNLCLLYGQKSKLPICQTTYGGSLSLASAIPSALKEFEAIAGSSDILIVGGEDFYDKEIIKESLTKTEVKFLSAVPLNDPEAIRIVDIISRGDMMESPASILYADHDGVGCATLSAPWYGAHKQYTHVYFDRMKNFLADTRLKEDLRELRYLYLKGELKEKDRDLFQKFFIINGDEPNESKPHLLNNAEEINKFLKREGYLVLISNHIKSAEEAYDLYLDKNCAEKAFGEYKQNLGMRPVFTENGQKFINESIVAFIALIFISRINSVALDNNLYKKRPCGKMLRQIAKLQAFLDKDNKYYLKPITNNQKEILEAFKIETPNRYILNSFVKNKLI